LSCAIKVIENIQRDVTISLVNEFSKCYKRFSMNRGWQYFLDLCHSTQDDTLLSELFDLLFTLEEKSSLETRCLIIKSLLEHKNLQRQISKELNVSIAKITRGSNELKRISNRLKTYLETILCEFE